MGGLGTCFLLQLPAPPLDGGKLYVHEKGAGPMRTVQFLHEKAFVFLMTLILISALAVSAYAGDGAGDGSGGGSGEPLTLISSSVPDGAENVATDETITLTFSKNVVNFTVRDSNKACFSMQDAAGTAVPVSVIMGDDQVDPSIRRIIQVTPVSALSPGSVYILTISGSVTSKSGVSLGQDIPITFTTASADVETSPSTAASAEKPAKTSAADPQTTVNSQTEETKTAGAAAVSEEVPDAAESTAQTAKEPAESGITPDGPGTSSADPESVAGDAASPYGWVIAILIIVAAAVIAGMVFIYRVHHKRR